MAGGIDWFRWHHGTVTDQKFPLLAKRAGASVAEVIAVWACLLEAASMNESERGVLDGEPDFEAMDCAMGMADGKAEAIFAAMRSRYLIDDHLQISAWPKRQPKREDDTAAERKRRQRERDHELQMAATVTGNESRTVTLQSHAVTCGHDRGEESREEKKRQEPSSPSAKKGARAAPLAPATRPVDVDEAVWRDWLALRKAKNAPVTPTVVEGAVKEAAKAGMSMEAFLRVWCARGSQGLQADWLKPNERPSQGPALVAQQPEWKRDRAHHLAVTTGGLLGKFKHEPETFDVAAERIG